MLAQLTAAFRDLQLPLRVKLWDGKQIDLGPKPRVTLVVKDPTLVTQLAHPSLDALGAAYVEGRVDLEGSIEEAIALIVNGFVREVIQELPMEFAVEAQKLIGISLEGSVG